MDPLLDYESLMLAAQSYVDAGRASDAVLTCNDATRLDPNRPEAYVIWGRALAQMDALTESSQRYEKARSLGSRDPTLFAELGSVYDVSKRYPEAAQIYRDYLSDHPRDDVIRGELALTLLLLQQSDAAVVQLQEAHRLRPERLQYSQDLGYALICAKRFGEARDILTPVVERVPSSRDAWRLLAQAYVGLGEKKRAEGILQKLGGS